ncbi:MAG: tRNA pseudouridine(13) synthase TruD [Phycisphaerae bacterium]
MPHDANDALARLPFLTEGVPPISGAIKRRYEDFHVVEVPLYEPCGEGTHCYVRIEKRGLATMRAVHDVARALGRSARDIGVAGLKDARGVTVQTLSIEHVDPEQVRALDIPRIRVLEVSLHRNKLRIGHLRGNRFRIRLREADPDRLPDVRAICEVLGSRGVPNYFGRQRFGLRGDTGRIGRAVLMGDHKTVVDLTLGRAGPSDTGDVLRARRLYDAEDYAAAADAWPRGFRDNARACRAMAQSHGNHRRAYHTLDARLRRLFVNAFQSELFNDVLAERIGDIDRVRAGDVAWKHDNGATFLVEDAEAEGPRATAFEISPTGPIFGPRMAQPAGEIAALEALILADSGVTLADFNSVPGAKVQGTRRPLRFRPEGLEIDAADDSHGPFIELAFTLPSGCYATMVLREVCKHELKEGLSEEGAVETA